MITSTRSILTLLYLAALIHSSSSTIEELQWYTLCHARCVAGCVQLPEMTRCWAECRDLGPAGHLDQPGNIRAEYIDGGRKLEWNPSQGASLYVVQYKALDSDNYTTAVTTNSWIDNFQLQNGSFCDPFSVQVAAFSGTSYSNFNFMRIDAPIPSTTPRIEHVSTEYSNETFTGDSYEANGTVLITFQIEDRNWPLGIADLAVIPMITITGCDSSGLYLPVNELKLVANASQQLAYSIGADMMRRECRYLYYIQSVTSQQCRTVKKYAEPPENEQTFLEIKCNSVTNSPCSSIQYFTYPSRFVHVIGSVVAIFVIVVCCNRAMKPGIPQDPMPTLPYGAHGSGNDHVYENYDDAKEYDTIRYGEGKDAGSKEEDALTGEEDG